MMKFLLIGIGGVYNYGCEAIIPGTEAIIHSEWPDAIIVYASRRPEDDRVRLAGCNIEIVPRKMMGRYSFKNLSRKALSLTGIQWYPLLDSLSAFEGYNAVLSIGGDIYTLRSNGTYNGNLPKFGDEIEKRGIPYILWGASIGPFDKNRKAEIFFRNHLSNIRLITARDFWTIEYLNSIGIVSNVVPCADPAFLVAPEVVAEREIINNRRRIAINLSPLSIIHNRMDVETTIKSQAIAITNIIKSFNIDVVLIPHVFCNFSEDDDDLRYLQRVLDKSDPIFRNNIFVCDNDSGFIGTKNILSECNLVVAARMHCAINAMAARVPTLLLGYSQKAYSMCKHIYGHLDWVLPLKDFNSDKCIRTIGVMLEKQSIIKDHLSRRIPEVQNEALSPITAIRNIVEV